MKIDNVYLSELQKTHRLTQRIEFLEHESYMAQKIAQAKETIWVEIDEAMNEIWPSIEIIFKQEELVQKAKKVIEDVNEYLG